MRRWLWALTVVSAGLVGCGGDDGEGEPVAKVTAGESCEAEKATVCGQTPGGQAAVLVCIAVDSKGNRKWSESDLCAKSERCVEDSRCEVNCDSPWLCDGKSCGDDGCGGNCGGCPVGSNCIAGSCVEYVCQAQCGNAQCGPDGCGGECGQCAGELVCVPPEYACLPKPAGCIPDCMDKECGPNGCGGSCGTCSSGYFCMPGELTCALPCMPDCTNRECGDDGCGGSCGGCAGENEFCSAAGLCEPCDPIKNVGCPPGSYCTYQGSSGPLCDVAGAQKYGEPCGGTDSCSEGVCIELSSSELGAVCYRICATHDDCGQGNQCIGLQDSAYMVCSTGAATLQQCNLLLQDCKLEEDGCYFDTNANAPVCLTAGSVATEGAVCSGQPNDCAEGLTCLSTSGAGWVCRKLCNTVKGEEPQCDKEGQYPTCTNYYAKQKAGYCK